MTLRLRFAGRLEDRLRNSAALAQAVAEASARRLRRGPRRPGWNWFVELCTEVLRRQLVIAFRMRDVNAARAYLDSALISSPALAEATFIAVTQPKFTGKWVTQKHSTPRLTALYLHGGGYSFYPRAYDHFTAVIAQAAGTRTFALDYRLAPEHPFPAQLEDALNAYCWILQTVHPADLVIIGDSAGGNLALALLIKLRDSKMPLPSMAIVLSPATDFETEYASMVKNQEFDWIDTQMLVCWAEWFTDASQRTNSLVSPIRADLHGLPPMYIQAGRCEILYDSIKSFADHARQHGVDVTLDSWKDMNHVFQLFGMEAPQSTEALRRIGEVIRARVHSNP